MTSPTPPAASGAPQPAPATTSIVDTVCVIYFAASGQMPLFVDTMAKANYRVFMPEEVLEEARARAASRRWDIRGLDRQLQTGAAQPGKAPNPIVVVPRIDANDPPAATLLAQVRSRHPKATATQRQGAQEQAKARALQQQAQPVPRLGQDEHLGECVVVTHGVVAARKGLRVRVGIDDLDGQNLATRHNLTFFTVEDALSLAVEHEVLDLNGARKAYEKMLPYGFSLPTWKASGMAARLRREANQRHTAGGNA